MGKIEKLKNFEDQTIEDVMRVSYAVGYLEGMQSLRSGGMTEAEADQYNKMEDEYIAGYTTYWELGKCAGIVRKDK